MAAADNGRSTPDFVISSFTLDDAGSMYLGGVVEAEDATHIVRIQVQNIGLAAGQASLALLLQGTASSGDMVLDTTDLGVIAAGAYSSVTVFSWAATIGNNQILKARVTSPDDVVPSNNEDQMLAQRLTISSNKRPDRQHTATGRRRNQRGLVTDGSRLFHRGAQHGCEKSICVVLAQLY